MLVAVVAPAPGAPVGGAETVTVAAEEAEVATGDELSEQMPLPTDPVTVEEEASAMGGDDEDMRDEAIADGIGGERGMPMTLPPPTLRPLPSLVERSLRW